MKKIQTQEHRNNSHAINCNMVSLPTISNLDDDIAMQKHYYSGSANWVIPNILMAGGSPVRAAEGVDECLESLIQNANISTFVNLQSEVNPPSSAENLGGKSDGHEADSLPDYSDSASAINPSVNFVYYGMVDEEAAESVDKLDEVVTKLVERIHNGEVLYVHCKGGSGRTGTIVSSILGKLYPELSADEVLERTQKYFEMRARGAGKWVNPKLKSPATEGQKDQVKEYLSSFRNGETVEEEKAYADDAKQSVPQTCEACILM